MSMTTTTTTQEPAYGSPEWFAAERAKHEAWWAAHPELKRTDSQPAATTTTTDPLARLDRLKLSVEREISGMERSTKALYQNGGAGHGQPLYAADVMEQKQKEALAPVLDAFAALSEAIAEAESEANRLETLAAGSSPLDSLSADELTRAAALDTFVGEELAAETQGNFIERISNRLATIAQGSDRAAMFAYLRNGEQRLNQIRQGPQGGTEPVSRIVDALATMRQKLANPNAEKAGQDAASLRRRALELRIWSGRTRSELDGTGQAAREDQRRWAQRHF